MNNKLARAIKTGEKCFSASEIAQLFHDQGGMLLHPTNVGNAAKKLDLDFLVEDPRNSGAPDYKPTKLYSEIDIPKIFSILRELENSRRKYEK